MIKFEYKIIKEVKEFCLEEELNKLGKDGWECFELKNNSDGVTLYLKRVLNDDIKIIYNHIDKYEDEWLKGCYRHYVDSKNPPAIWNSTDPCTSCPNNPANQQYPVIGDSPCQWCSHWKYKITTSGTTTEIK